MRGQTGTQVIVEFEEPDNEIKEISLERRSVDLRPVRTKRIRNESHTFGYLRITQFSEGVPEQVKEALEELSGKDIDGLILDLRNNSAKIGGLKALAASLETNTTVHLVNVEGNYPRHLIKALVGSFKIGKNDVDRIHFY